MRNPRLGPPLALALALLLPACASTADRVVRARHANDAALAANPWPEDAAWVVAAGGVVTGAPELAAALAVRPDAPHRYIFRPGEPGDVRLTLAFHPGRGVVAGRAAARALGVTFRRRARGGTQVVRDVRRVDADDDATIALIVSPIGGGPAYSVPAVIDPEFDGSLLVAPAVADRLGLWRYEIPGTADVHVALGRPFLGARARLHAAIRELGVEAELEAVVPR